MPYIQELVEWNILRGLGLLLGQKGAQFVEQLRPLSHMEEPNLNARLFEVELRRALLVKNPPNDLSHTNFSTCRANLSTLCSQLENLVHPWSTEGYIEHQSQAYPCLQALTKYLESASEPVDLFIGPNQAMFRLPDDTAEIRACLNAVTSCNNNLDRVLTPLACKTIARPVQRQPRKGAWKKARIRNQAMLVFGALSKRIQCDVKHQVLFKLIQDPDVDILLPCLQLVLSSCSDSNSELWNEIVCHSSYLSGNTIKRIDNICTDMLQHQGRGKALTLLIENERLFGAWATTTSSKMDYPSRESFHQLIIGGAFRPLDISMLFGNAPPAKFSVKDKRALALKLGFCLMDFFDTEVNPKNIFFMNCSDLGLDKESPYLAFSDLKTAAPVSLYHFKLGHPTFLSVAKMLLEMEFGQSINLQIGPSSSQNKHAWISLMESIEELQAQRSDFYLEAVRGCLFVHHHIATALRQGDFRGRDADLTIRKTLYDEVVYYLERGLAEATPRAVKKRQRSESPAPPNSSNGCGTFANRSADPEQSKPEYRKRRQLETQRAPRLSAADFDCGETHSKPSRDCCVACPKSPFMKASELQNGTRCTQHLSSDYMAPNRSNAPARRPDRREGFEVAIICALPLEYNAISYLFDEFWDERGDQYGSVPEDPNFYTTGRMGNCNIVLALLSQMGKTSAASAAATMRLSYSNIKLALLVGVCGAAPCSQDREILLGDVIISKTIVQYDFGRRYPNRFSIRDTTWDNLGRPNKVIRNLLALLETDREHDNLEQRTAYFLQQLQAKAAQKQQHGKYEYPRTAKDKLFESSYRHKHRKFPSCACCDCESDSDPVCDEALSSSCDNLGCDDRYLVSRNRLRTRAQREHDGGGALHMAAVHIGTFGSGDSVMKSAADRDRISREAGVIAFEMEGAGVWDEVPSVVIKGVCDYADSHKHKDWQDFAAATAASASRAILERYVRN